MRSSLRSWFRLGIALAAAVAGCREGDAGAADWPTWRGPNHDGISVETNAPTHWNRKDNVRWRTALPEPGNSSPIVWGDAVFITQSSSHRRVLVALDRKTGKTRWNGVVEARSRGTTAPMNPHCASSPVTDGEHIYVWFGSEGLHAFDLAGNRTWSLDLGPQRHAGGYSSSPVLFEDRIFLNFGPGEEEFIVAVNRRTGRELWRARGPTKPAKDSYGTWSTPLMVQVDNHPQLIVAVRDYFAGLDPADGAEIWKCRGMGPYAKASPCAGEGVVVMAGDWRGAEIGVRLGGRGDVTDTHRLWREFPARSRVATGIVHRGHVYGARANGLLDCLTLETGDSVWEERMPGAGVNSPVWGCPILVGNLLYFVNQGADVAVVEASPKYNLVAVNSLTELCNASPAVAYGDLFIRTWSALWCIRGDADGSAGATSGREPKPDPLEPRSAQRASPPPDAPVPVPPSTPTNPPAGPRKPGT